MIKLIKQIIKEFRNRNNPEDPDIWKRQDKIKYKIEDYILNPILQYGGIAIGTLIFLMAVGIMCNIIRLSHIN